MLYRLSYPAIRKTPELGVFGGTRIIPARDSFATVRDFPQKRVTGLAVDERLIHLVSLESSELRWCRDGRLWFYTSRGLV